MSNTTIRPACELDRTEQNKWVRLNKGNKLINGSVDRSVGSDSWSDRIPKTKVTHLTTSRSDHLPLLIEYKCINQC